MFKPIVGHKNCFEYNGNTYELIKGMYKNYYYDEDEDYFFYVDHKSFPDCKIEEISKDCEIELPIPNTKSGGSVKFIKNYFTDEEALNLYDHLVKELKWERRTTFNNAGFEYKEPRETCWFGRPYSYSNVDLEATTDWDVKLEKLRDQLNKEFKQPEGRAMNSVMCNHYCDENDSIGWHADDEASLGRDPYIISITLGCTRPFDVCLREEFYEKHKTFYAKHPLAPFKGCTKMYRFLLNPGSVLIMSGPMQDYWLHRVPKSNEKMLGRINLTYRYIVDKEEENVEIERAAQLRMERRMKSKQNLQQESKINVDTGDNWETHKNRMSIGDTYEDKRMEIEDNNKNTNNEMEISSDDNNQNCKLKDTNETKSTESPDVSNKSLHISNDNVNGDNKTNNNTNDEKDKEEKKEKKPTMEVYSVRNKFDRFNNVEPYNNFNKNRQNFHNKYRNNNNAPFNKPRNNFDYRNKDGGNNKYGNLANMGNIDDLSWRRKPAN